MSCALLNPEAVISVTKSHKVYRVLVLDASSAAGLECIQSLGRFGAHIDAAAESPNCTAFHSRYVGRRMVQLPVGRDFAAWIRELDRAADYDLIIPATEISLLGILELADSPEFWRKTALPSRSALEIALDKQKTWEHARALGVPVPPSELLNPEMASPPSRFPVVLKPLYSRKMEGESLQARQVIIASNKEDRDRALTHELAGVPVQQQEYVAGFGVGIELLFEKGQRRWAFAHERVHEYPLTGGGSSYRKSIAPPKDLVSAADALLSSLNWHGIAMVEFKMNAGDDFYLMEINPRLWGSLALAVDAGVDFPVGLLLLATNQPLPPQPSFKIGYFARNIPRDVKWQLANFRADHGNPFLLTRHRVLSLLELLRPLWGRESWDHFDWHDLGVTRAMLAEVAREATATTRRIVRQRIEAWQARRRHRALLRRLRRAKTLPRKILFLCYGNICRSPVAERLAASRLPGLDITSAGFHAIDKRPCSGFIQDMSAGLGINVVDHRSRQVRAEELDAADLILVMDMQNFMQLKQISPDAVRRTTFLGLFSKHPILNLRDPYELPEREAVQTLTQIAASVDGLCRVLGVATG